MSGRGGSRAGSGRKRKTHDDAKSMEIARAALQQSKDEQKSRQQCISEQDELANHKGRSWTYRECCLILTLLLGIIVMYDTSPTDAIAIAAALLRCSTWTLRKLWVPWRDEKKVFVVDSTIRGKGAPSHLLHLHRTQCEIVFYLGERIREWSSKGIACNAKMIIKSMHDDLGVDMKRRQVYNLLSSMGFHYSKAKTVGKMNDAWYQARIHTFLVQYERALNEQRDGACVIVYTDESYVNLNHSLRYTWTCDVEGAEIDFVRPSGKGRRLIILHAFTRDGWLQTGPSDHNANADENSNSCELVFEAQKKDEDYHSNMNKKIYKTWLETRLIPLFAACYPGKKMCLVLDNAAYHHCRGRNWLTPSTMNKTKLVDALIDRCDITYVEVQRKKAGTNEMETVCFEQHDWMKTGGRNGPTVKELRARLSEYLAANPNTNQTEVAALMHKHHHELLYTPLYLPQVQPIESVWAYVKHHVAAKYENGRTMETLIAQLRQGFYGDGADHAGLTAELSGRLIEHTLDYCKYLIEKDDDWNNDPESLLSSNHDNVVEIDRDIEADMEPFEDAIEDDE